jgi:hypothetical protein
MPQRIPSLIRHRFLLPREPEPRKSSVAGKILSVLAGALIPVFSGALTYVIAERSLSEKKVAALAEIDGRNTEMVKDISFKSLASASTYEEKVLAIKFIAVHFGIAEAINFAEAAQNGATIRALQELHSAATVDDKMLIELALINTKKTLFIDSSSGKNVYCTASQNTGRTNIDDIVVLVRDLPMKIAGVKFHPGDVAVEAASIKEIKNIIEEDRPDVIVAHLDAFEGISTGNQDDELKQILDLAVKGKSDTQVVIYSRSTPQILQTFRNTLDPSSGTFIALLSLKKMECFLSDSQNGKMIENAISAAIYARTLYRSSFALP